MLKHVFALIAIAAASTAANSADIKLAKVMTFKDWAVACDNGLDCEATSFMAEDFPGDGLALSMSRDAGRDGAITIAIHGFETKADRYRLMVDRRVIDTGSMSVGAGEIQISGADAMKVARALVAGSRLKMTDGAGAELGQLSLAGSAAALRYMDAAQDRAGSVSAIAARGRKAATGRMVALPVIEAAKIAPHQILPDAGSLVALSESSPCAAERFGASEDTAYSLGTSASGATQALVLLNCGAGAYNFSYGAYVGTRDAGGKWTFAPASFDFMDLFTESGNVPLLINADWDAASQSLSSYSKGRGVGDCGSSEQYVWDGTRLRLTLATSMDECRGSMDWLTVWRADVKLKG